MNSESLDPIEVSSELSFRIDPPVETEVEQYHISKKGCISFICFFILMIGLGLYLIIKF